MLDRFTRIGLVVALLLLTALVAQPYLTRVFLAETQPRTVAARGDLGAGEQGAVELFERVSPSVVHVFAGSGRRDLMMPDEGGGMGGSPGGGPGGGSSSGTGFVWDAAGHIVTNNHVVEGANPAIIRLASGDIAPAEVVGTAPNYDLAVLRAGGLRQLPPPIAIGSSAELRVGQAAYAIGNPFGLDQTLTTGVVSALQRRLPTSGGREIADVIQTDAAINPGNSGGPLLDSAGRLIGVNTAIFSPSGAFAGIGFAIPVDVVNRVVPELIRNGRMPIPGIGIVAAPEAAAARMGIEGVVIVRTAQGSPADSAGLRGIDGRTGELGDVITAVNGEAIRRLSDLTTQLERVGVGQRAEITVQRGRGSATVTVNVVDLGDAR